LVNVRLVVLGFSNLLGATADPVKGIVSGELDILPVNTNDPVTLPGDVGV
jgi:hypothetical protein